MLVPLKWDPGRDVLDTVLPFSIFAWSGHFQGLNLRTCGWQPEAFTIALDNGPSK